MMLDSLHWGLVTEQGAPGTNYNPGYSICTWKSFSAVRMLEHCSRLHREVVQTPSLESCCNSPRHCDPEQPVLGDVALARSLD